MDTIRKYQPRCGGRKLFIELNPFFNEHQITMGRDNFFDLLRTNKLLVRRIKRSVHTTNSKHHFHRYPNMGKDFTPLKAHEMWVADITYIPLKNRFAYLFLITDAYTRKIVGFHVSDDRKVSSAPLALKIGTGTKTAGNNCYPSQRQGHTILQYCLCSTFTTASCTHQHDAKRRPL